LVFNYDKATGKVGSNKNNLENALTEVKDFFLKKQDIEKPYTLSKDEYSFFERMKKELSDSQLNGSAEDSKDAMLQLAEEITGADSSLVKYIQDTDVASVSQVGFAQSQKTVIQGTTKFSAVMKTAGGVAKSFVATLGSMAVAAAAAWAIGKAIEGIDYIIHYDENIIKAGQEAKDSIDSTFKSFEEGKQSIMDLGSSFGDQTEQIKNTGDAIDQVAEKYVELRKGVNQNTNENVSLSTDEYQQYIDLSSKLASQFPGLVAGYDSQGNAVLNLASNADKAADSIRNLYEAQVSSANVDMGKNLQATYDGVVTQTSQYAEDIQKKRDELAQLNTDISENKRSILTYTLNGTGDGSVKKAVSDAVAKIVAEAPEAYDTLKEISDWITNHTSDAATMNSQINTNKTDIANLKTLIGTLPDTATSKDIVSYIAEYVSKALADSDLSQYATAEALKACVGRVDAIEKKIPTLEAADTANTEAINGVKTRVETVEGKVKAIEDDLAVEKPKIAKNATDIAALQGLVGDGYEAIPSEKIQALFKVTE